MTRTIAQLSGAAEFRFRVFRTAGRAVLDLNAIVGRLAPMLGRIIGEHIALAIRTGPGGLAVKADPGQLEQVIMNLVVNGRDVMPEGGNLTIETGHTDVNATEAANRPGLQPGQYHVLVVSDTGHGMDAHTKAHLFEPFFTTKDAGRGTGLGLSTVYGIVKQSGGFVFVDSEPGQGSTFRLYFPPAAGDIDPLPELRAARRAERGTETVLLVEDESGVLKFAKRVLVARGYNVLAASSPEEAQRLCAGGPGPIDLLLTDLVIAGLTGRALYGILSERLPGLKVVYMSGYANEDVVDPGLLDPQAFLAKPFTASALASKIREVLDEI